MAKASCSKTALKDVRWMLTGCPVLFLDALTVFRHFSSTFNAINSYCLLTTFSTGLPVIIVAISIGVRPDGYGTEH